MGAAIPIAAGIGVLGSLFGGAQANRINVQEAQKNRDFQAAQAGTEREFESGQAQIARDFEERMSNTAYQRATNDMRMAGINPMLAYMQGGASSPSASAPSGAAGSGAQATVHDQISPAISTALQGMRVVQDIKNMNAQVELLSNQSEKAHQEALLTQQQSASQSVDRALHLGMLKALGFSMPPGSLGMQDLVDDKSSLDARYKDLRNQLSQLDVTTGKSTAKFQSDNPIMDRILGGIRATVRAAEGR